MLANLVVFARLYGYVRYFHPSDEAADLNWGRVAINGVAAIKGAEDAADLAQKLQAFFEPCAPTLQVFPVDERPELPIELAPPGNVEGLQVVMWQHYGVGIQPTVFVSRTIQGIAEGRDEQLERAIKVVKQAP